MTLAQHFDRFADIVIASLVGAWSVELMLKGLPGLAGVDLPISSKAAQVALLVLLALAVQMVLETVAAHWYPRRLGRVQQAHLPVSSVVQRFSATMLTLAVFLFVAVSYVGVCWQLYLGGILFLIPPLLRLWRDRFPNFRTLYVIASKGIVKAVLLLLIGALIGAFVLSSFHQNRELIRDSLVLLSLPGFALSIVGLFGREGPRRQLQWRHQVLGALVLATGVLFVLGVIVV